MCSSFLWILFCLLLFSVSHSIWNFLKEKEKKMNPNSIFTKKEKLEMEQQLNDFITTI